MSLAYAPKISSGSAVETCCFCSQHYINANNFQISVEWDVINGARVFLVNGGTEGYCKGPFIKTVHEWPKGSKNTIFWITFYLVFYLSSISGCRLLTYILTVWLSDGRGKCDPGWGELPSQGWGLWGCQGGHRVLDGRSCRPGHLGGRSARKLFGCSATFLKGRHSPL